MDDAGSARGPGRQPWVGPLAEFGAADLALAGGKGANLGELVREGFPVPPGFVITTAAYEHALRSAGQAAGQVPADEEAAQVPVPDDLRTEILAAYRGLGAGRVAVRSSATAEDLPGAAFAGQQDTFLNVVGEAALLAAVAKCWTSLWTDRAIAYRSRLGIGPAQVRIAVVVQVMVSADWAGVLFSANPVSGSREELVVDAARGPGEAVVSGTVTPDLYVLDRAGHVKRRHSGQQETVSRGKHDGGPELSGDILRQLAALASAAAWHFGSPQDIEWACAGGRLYILQARPMTALPPPPVKLNRLQRLAAPFFVEMFPVRPFPLDVTGWMEHGILGMVGRMADSIGMRYPTVAQLLPEEEGVVVRLVPPTVRPGLKALALPLLLTVRARRFHLARWTADPRFRDYEAHVAQQAGRDIRQLSWPELRALPRGLMGGMRTIADLRIDYLPAALLPVARLHLRLALLGLHRLAADLVAGAHTRTTDANDALDRLARLVRRDAALRSAFARLDQAELAAEVDSNPQFSGFRGQLDAFLAEYGHRETATPLLASQPTWRDAPDVVLGLVKVLVGGQAAGETAGAEAGTADTVGTGERAADALALLRAHPALRKPERLARMLRLVCAAQSGAAFREDTHFYGTQLLPLVRRSFLEIGRRLQGAGVLDRPEDVFHLRLEELEGIDGDPGRGIGAAGGLGAAEASGLCAAVAARAEKRASLAGVPLINPHSVFPDRAVAAADALVTGTGASSGTATGRVRVVRSPADFGTLRSGEVLVCPYTNPAWTPLFQRAAAVVVDAGGLGSHAAIVAREYGIPAVMGTRDGTAVLKDGQQVTVDGYRGRITARSGR
jgi:rifampicin phosphotransferase